MDATQTLESLLGDPVEPARSSARSDALDAAGSRQREICERLLERWVPLAVSAELILRKEGRSGPVIDEDPFEAGLKSGVFVLKVLERLARLDGLDARGKREDTGPEKFDAVELSRRAKIVSPVLTARLDGPKADTPKS